MLELASAYRTSDADGSERINLVIGRLAPLRVTAGRIRGRGFR